MVLEHKDSVLSCRKTTSTCISRSQRTMIWFKLRRNRFYKRENSKIRKAQRWRGELVVVGANLLRANLQWGETSITYKKNIWELSMRNAFYILDLHLQPSSHSSQLLRPLYILSIYPPHLYMKDLTFLKNKKLLHILFSPQTITP